MHTTVDKIAKSWKFLPVSKCLWFEFPAATQYWGLKLSKWTDWWKVSRFFDTFLQILQVNKAIRNYKGNWPIRAYGGKFKPLPFADWKEFSRSLYSIYTLIEPKFARSDPLFYFLPSFVCYLVKYLNRGYGFKSCQRQISSK